MLFSVFLASASFASKADELLAKADKLVVEAQTAKHSTDRDENYNDAIKIYTGIAKDYTHTPEAATAIYRHALILDVAEGKLHNPYQAHKMLNEFVAAYDKPASAYPLLEKNEIREIGATVADAKELVNKLAIELDKENQKKIQYKIMDFFVKLTGAHSSFSYWFAIILVTVLVKLLITPLTKKQFKAMKEMQTVAPLIKELQEKYKGDQKTIGEKTMDIYKEHKINPFASCLPILVQFPIMLGLYSMIRSYEFQFAKGTFLWIGSGFSHIFSILVPFANATVWVTAKNLSEPDLILVVLYLISMYVSTKMSAVDPSQAEQQKMMAVMMPVMFAFIFAGFPSAFLLYWLVFNILQTVQQYLIMRGGPTVAVAGGAPALPTEGDSTDSARVRRRNRRRR